MKRIDFERIEEENYLYNVCELLFNKYFNPADDQELKSFETEIWMIGSEIIENIRKAKGTKIFTESLLLEPLKNIKIKRQLISRVTNRPRRVQHNL